MRLSLDSSKVHAPRGILRRRLNLLRFRAARRLVSLLHDTCAENHFRLIGSLGKGVKIQDYVVIEFPERVSLGDGVFINAFCHIWANHGVSIGANTLIASHVAITSATHPTDSEQPSQRVIGAPVEIGENVWIGTHATILPGVRIGDGAIVAAGAVVREDVPASSIVAGVPARILRYKSSAEEVQVFASRDSE
jgi:acetyltransferase-like isoleucine patch superfamily enzyme